MVESFTLMEKKTATGRLVSLDAFRGIAIAGMVLVNNPGDWDTVYAPLLHAEWHGWTPTDLVFPSFMFIVGVSIVFSLGKRLQSGNRREVYYQILRRSFVIFLLGVFLNLFPQFDFTDFRATGVLQRIAVVYLIASILVLNVSIRAQAWICVGLLILYWALLELVPVPGFGAGVLTPEGNLAAYLDSLFLPGQMWQGTWDPEGILSTIPSISTTLLGVLTGHFVRSERDRRDIAGWLFVVGWAGLILGLLWDILFPINKNIWTSSFTVFTAGASLQFLGVCYWLIDVKGLRKWFYPAIVFGMNAIALYVLSEVFGDILSIAVGGGHSTLKDLLFKSLFLSWAGPKSASLAFAIVYVAIWFFIMNAFYRRRIFIKV